MKIFVINGPNINMLGLREPGIYGNQKKASDNGHHVHGGSGNRLVIKTAVEENLEIDQYQSNHEGDLVDKIQAAYGIYDAIVINPAAYTHTSIAILDALKAVGLPAVEVHISDVSQREDFRQISYTRLACEKTIMGQGLEGYRQAILYLKEKYA